MCPRIFRETEPSGGPSSSSKRAARPRQARSSGARPRAGRLMRHQDFERVYRDGKRLGLADFTVLYRYREDGSGARLRVGFTVGRILGGAVVRNRIRRRLREAVRLGISDAPSVDSRSADLVIQPRKSALKAPFSSLKRQVAEAFRKIEPASSARMPREATGDKSR